MNGLQQTHNQYKQVKDITIPNSGLKAIRQQATETLAAINFAKNFIRGKCFRQTQHLREWWYTTLSKWCDTNN